MADLKVVEAYPVWEFECPKCRENTQLCDGDFHSDIVNGVVTECAEAFCENCKATFTVVHD
jgi:hypothetical protein